MKSKLASRQWPGINGIRRRHLQFNWLHYRRKVANGRCRPRSRWKGHNSHPRKKLTSVNCSGQNPTFSPSLASIQFSSTRLMKVRMSPCMKHKINNRLKTTHKTGHKMDLTECACPRDWALSSETLCFSTNMWHKLPLCLQALSFSVASLLKKTTTFDHLDWETKEARSRAF